MNRIWLKLIFFFVSTLVWHDLAWFGFGLAWLGLVSSRTTHKHTLFHIACLACCFFFHSPKKFYQKLNKKWANWWSLYIYLEYQIECITIGSEYPGWNGFEYICHWHAISTDAKQREHSKWKAHREPSYGIRSDDGMWEPFKMIHFMLGSARHSVEFNSNGKPVDCLCHKIEIM